MPITRPPNPLGEKKESRFDAFMERNIVIVSILAPLIVVAIFAAIVHH